MTTVNGNLIIYEALKNKQLSHITPRLGQPSFCASWNQHDPKYIVMSTAASAVFVVEIADYPVCKQLRVMIEYPHPNKVFGCCWNPIKATEFVTACEDGYLRVYDTQSGVLHPVKTLEGHTKKIYNVIFSPVLPNVVATGSDDRSIRIWRIDEGSSPVAICGGEGIKNSHT